MRVRFEHKEFIILFNWNEDGIVDAKNCYTVGIAVAPKGSNKFFGIEPKMSDALMKQSFKAVVSQIMIIGETLIKKYPKE